MPAVATECQETARGKVTMKLNQAARDVIGDGANAVLVTLSPKGNPQMSAVWVGIEETEHGDELVSGHFLEHQKVKNVQQNPRVVVGIFDPHPDHWEGAVKPFLRIAGTASIERADITELETRLGKAVGNPDADWPPPGGENGYITRIHIDKVGGMGPWDSGAGTRIDDFLDRL
jgi:hypothetical protein